MKAMFIGIAVAAAIFTGCSGGSNPSHTPADSSTGTTHSSAASTATHGQPTASSQDILSAYLSLKTALVQDDGTGAATAGKKLSENISQLDTSVLSAAQKQVYDDVRDDIQEQAEHIGSNAGKLAHQREHFDMLSKDVYDLTKVITPSAPLYVDFCPMYNGGKGAIWLSEVKQIQNPYYGQKMATCGSIKTEIGK